MTSIIVRCVVAKGLICKYLLFFLQHPLLQLKCNIAHDCKNDADSEKIENLCAMHEMKQNVESLNEAVCVMKMQNRFPQRWKS